MMDMMGMMDMMEVGLVNQGGPRAMRLSTGAIEIIRRCFCQLLPLQVAAVRSCRQHKS